MNVLSCKGNIILLYHQCKSFDNQPDFVRDIILGAFYAHKKMLTVSFGCDLDSSRCICPGQK